MYILASIPTIIRKTKGEIVVYISVYPLITNNEILDNLKQNLDIEESCKDIDFAQCFTMLYGGIVISKNNTIKRIELEGCVKEGVSSKDFDPNEFLHNPYDCYNFDQGTLCFSNKKENECKMIDNIGLRFIIK